MPEVDLLRHLVRRLNFQGQLGHDAKRAKRHNRARKVISVDVPLQIDQAPVGNDKLHCCHRGGENALIIARTMSTGGAGPGDRDIWNRGCIRQRKARPMEPLGHVGVGQGGRHRHGGVGRIDAECPGQAVKQHEVPGAVDDPAEGVATSKRT